MYKIGIIGDRDSTLCFMALGFSVFEASDPAQAAELLHKVAKSGEYAVIFIIEDLALAMSEAIDHYKDAPLPAIDIVISFAPMRYVLVMHFLSASN